MVDVRGTTLVSVVDVRGNTLVSVVDVRGNVVSVIAVLARRKGQHSCFCDISIGKT